MKALTNVVHHGVSEQWTHWSSTADSCLQTKIVYVASLNDQVVPSKPLPSLIIPSVLILSYSVLWTLHHGVSPFDPAGSICGR